MPSFEFPLQRAVTGTQGPTGATGPPGPTGAAGPLPIYTVATLPSAAPPAQLVYVSNGTANKRLAVSDGSVWRWPDGAVVT